MRLCARCSFPVEVHPEDGLVHIWDASDLSKPDDAPWPMFEMIQVDAGQDIYGNRKTRWRRAYSVRCPADVPGYDERPAATLTPDGEPVNYLSRAMTPLLTGREEIRDTGTVCVRCEFAVVAAVVDQHFGHDAVRPAVGPTIQAVIAGCPCGAAAAMVGLQGVTAYREALVEIEAELGDAVKPGGDDVDVFEIEQVDTEKGPTP